MDSFELLIQTEHPPHSNANKKRGVSLRAPRWVRIETVPLGTTDKKNGLVLSRIFLKIVLFIVIFILSFHLPHLNPGIKLLSSGLQKRDQTIKEIMEILDGHPTGLANVTKEELAEVIYEEANRYHHDPKFILALISIESSFQNWSVSQRGAKGLMQIMPYVAESLAHEMGIEWSGDRTLFNPFLNIKMGIYYLSRLILDFDDLELALTAYNCGPTYVKSLIEKKQKVPGHYYRKILEVYQNL